MRRSAVALGLLVLVGSLALCGGSTRAAETAKSDHAEVSFDGIGAKEAQSIADTIAAAWKVYVDDFAADMPEKVTGSVECGAKQPTRLWTDGWDRLFLTIPDRRKLAPPAKSGVFNLYGMCHELGHMAMYRTLKDHGFLTHAALEGWAHFAGSVVVDRVHAAKGPSLWHEPYDYLQDGTARLDRQLASKAPGDTALGAGAWKKLDAIVGRKSLAKLFARWQKDQPRGADAVYASVAAEFPEHEKALAAWWKEGAAKLLVEPPPEASSEARVTVEPKLLAGKPVEQKGDDGTAEGKRSIAGGGHARKFAAPGGGQWFVTSISVHGGRYGPSKAPDTKFDLALCDVQMRPIATWSFRYADFAYGGEDWAKFALQAPTRVPTGEFYVCLDLKPTATNGVYVSIDESTTGASLFATPGRAGRPLDKGDWMIRVTLDRRADKDALGEK